MAETLSARAVDFVNTFEWKTGETPLTSWQFLLAVHIIYAGTLFVLSDLMKTRESPKKFVKTFGFFSQLIYVCLVSSDADRLGCGRSPTESVQQHEHLPVQAY
mmetsp:Transcript_43259/g.84790  ORF Transcript_43259/g.84790 Transcript_43259/m.84790 type:complete len:103 (-) Transcript_43259:4164-4472(-)